MRRPGAVLRRTAAGALLAGLLVPLWGASAALATETVPGPATETATIDDALPGDGTVRLLVSVPGAAQVDLDAVSVTLGGEEVEAEVVDAARSTVRRTTILAIDTSASMAGARINEARKAATAYLASVPANVEVGVLTFDDSVNLLVPATLERAPARKAIAGLELTRRTALYDGILGAIEALGPVDENDAQRKILVLSDGKDTSSTRLEDVVEQIRESGAGVDVVSLQQGDEANAPLNAIAAAGKGEVLTAADPAALSAAFSREADALARQIVVTAQVPESQKERSADVAVSVPTAAQSFTAAAYLPVRSAAAVAADSLVDALPQAVVTGPLDISETMMFGGVAAMAVGLLGFVGVLATGGNRAPSHLTLDQQVKAYGVMAVPGQSGPRRDAAGPQVAAFAGQARQAAEKALKSNKNLEARISQSLDAAGLALRPAEWLLLRAGLAVAGGLLAVLLGSGSPALGVLVVVVAVVGPWIYLRMKRTRRLKAFSLGLADTLQLMSGSLSAGLSLAQSIDTIVREGAEPISSEFRRVVIESRLGVTLEDSLEGVAKRMQSRDFEWVVMAIRIQRDVGGNLAELLLTVAATLREREYLRRQVHALSAEGRLSCYVLGGLPPGFLAYLAVSKPDYVHPMFTTPMGWLMCAGMVILLAVGIFWMAKVSKVDV